ncbi:hypothetical protein V4U86_28335 [Mycobacterium sp. AMU20-3851]|uniref:hypothetical protein n=1 Tax=Mycobacterium sp. AMU20-3851 TaxID=3122055 RepID=UPI003754D9A2
MATELLTAGATGGAARHARASSSTIAQHIGRVGALAVSLGVGFAIADSAQPAYADTGASSSNESASASDAGSSSAGSGPADRKRGPRTATKPTADADATGDDSDSAAGLTPPDEPTTEPDETQPDATEPDETEPAGTEPDETASETGDTPTEAVTDDVATDAVKGSRKGRTYAPTVEPMQVHKSVTAVVQAVPDPEVESAPQVETDTQDASAAAPVTTEVAPAPAIQDTQATVEAVTPKMTAASSTLGTRTATTNPLDLLVNTMMAWVARQISHTFVNRTPIAGPIVYEQNLLGQVYIDLNATDPNGDVLAYDIIQPEHGWVYRDLISGKFVYTPWALVSGQPLVDSFKVVIRDDSEHLPGVLGQIQAVVEKVTRFLGIAQADNLTVTIPVTVDPVVQAPPLVTPIVGGGYQLGKDPAPIVSTVDIVDGDTLGLKRVVIKIATLAQAGDTLSYNAPSDSPIIGSWDAETLTLTLTGNGTLAEYEQAIKAVNFAATQGAGLVRGITISATDQDDVDNIAPGFVTVAVWPATKLPPLVTPIAGGGFTLGGNPARIVSAIDIVDGDSGRLSKVTLRIETLAQSGDALNYSAPQGNPVIGSWDATTRTLTLSGDATLAQYEEAIKAVTFSATQSAGVVRGIAISATDEDGVGNVAPGFVTVGVWAAPTLPPLVTPIAGGGFTLGGNPAKIVSAIDIVDVDSGRLSKVTVKISTMAQAGDVLNYVAPEGNPVIGVWNAAERTLTLSGPGTLAQYEEALRAVTFSATQGAALVRGLSISAIDEHGVSNIAPGFVTVAVSSPTRYLPLVTPIGGRSYTIGESPTKPVAGVDIVDADSSHLQQVTMRVTTFGKSGDTLTFAGLTDNPITATYDAETRTLTLSGIATKQQYEEALKAVTFTATQGGWTTRTITIVATDTDGVNSSTASLTLSVW